MTALVLTGAAIDDMSKIEEIIDKQLEIFDPSYVDINVSGTHVWINVNGVCAIRIARAGSITLQDNRA